MKFFGSDNHSITVSICGNYILKIYFSMKLEGSIMAVLKNNCSEYCQNSLASTCNGVHSSEAADTVSKNELKLYSSSDSIFVHIFFLKALSLHSSDLSYS